MTEYKYLIKGPPVAWARSGLCKGKFYDKQKADKLILGIDLERQHNDRPLLRSPLVLEATYFFKIPKSHHKKQDQMMGTPMAFTSDLDNLVKFTCDLCKDIVIYDDRIIWKITAQKLWWSEDKTEFSFFCV